MRALIAIAALLAAGSAHALSQYSFFPTGTSWSVTSSMDVVNGGFTGYTCPATIAFKTTLTGDIKITTMSVGGCQGVTFTGLPWNMVADGTMGYSTHLAWTYPGGSCTAKLIFLPQATRVIYDTSDGHGCDISGVFVTTPTLSIGLR